MKKSVLGVLGVAAALFIFATTAFAAGPGNRCNFTDTNGDGVCDNVGYQCESWKDCENKVYPCEPQRDCENSSYRHGSQEDCGNGSHGHCAKGNGGHGFGRGCGR